MIELSGKTLTFKRIVLHLERDFGPELRGGEAEHGERTFAVPEHGALTYAETVRRAKTDTGHVDLGHTSY